MLAAREIRNRICDIGNTKMGKYDEVYGIWAARPQRVATLRRNRPYCFPCSGLYLRNGMGNGKEYED